VESPSIAQSPEAREAERVRVLEAAGLLRRRSSRATPKRKRRPPPPRPQRRYRESTNLEEAIAAPLEVADQEQEVPEDEEEQEERMEDAYDVSQFTLFSRLTATHHAPSSLCLAVSACDARTSCSSNPLLTRSLHSHSRLYLPSSFSFSIRCSLDIHSFSCQRSFPIDDEFVLLES